MVSPPIPLVSSDRFAFIGRLIIFITYQHLHDPPTLSLKHKATQDCSRTRRHHTNDERASRKDSMVC